MPINIEELSAEDLFELANRKKKEEQEKAKRVAALAEQADSLKAQRTQLEREHEEALRRIDSQISELQKKRSQLVTEHRVGLKSLDTSLGQLQKERSQLQEKSVIPPADEFAAAPSATPSASRSLGNRANGDFEKCILDLMKGRNYVSDSLLKEKLRTKGFDVKGLDKCLERLLREKKISKKGGGNYALEKKRT